MRTNRIQEFFFDFQALKKIFRVYEIRLKPGTKFQRASKAIRAQFQPLGLVKKSQENFLMIQETGKNPDPLSDSTDPCILARASPIHMEHVEVHNLARLLICAMAYLKREYSEGFENETLHYFVDRKVLSEKNPAEIIKTLAVDIVPSSMENEWILKISGQTYTSLQAWSDKDDLKSLEWRPRFRFDKKKMKLHRDPVGDFIRKSRYPGSRETYVVSDTKSLPSFRRSKSGVYARFFNDLKSMFDNSFSILLTEISHEPTRINPRAFKAARTRLNDAMKSMPLTIHDSVETNISQNIVEIFRSVAIEYGINSVRFFPPQSDSGTIIDEVMPTIVLLPTGPRNNDERSNVSDPYNLATHNFPICQSFIVPGGTVDEKSLRTKIAKSLEDLFVKWEVACRRTRFWNGRPETTFILVDKFTEEDKKKKNIRQATVLNIMPSGVLSFYRSSFEDCAEKAGNRKDWPLLSRTTQSNEELLYLYKNSAPDGVIAIITDEMVSLPKFEEIEKDITLYHESAKKYFPAKALSDFIASCSHEQLTSSGRIFCSDLTQILDRLQAEGRKSLTYKDLKVSKNDAMKYLTSRGKTAESFFRTLQEEYGVWAKRPKRSQREAILENHVGLFYDARLRRYQVGGKGGPEVKYARFNRLKRIVSTGEPMSTDAFVVDLLKEIFVSYGRFTVLPWPVKHINEFNARESRETRIGVSPDDFRKRNNSDFIRTEEKPSSSLRES